MKETGGSTLNNLFLLLKTYSLEKNCTYLVEELFAASAQEAVDLGQGSCSCL